MRKVILSILLAGVTATPAVAQDHGRWRQNQEQSDSQTTGRQAAREARQEARQERQQAQPQQQVQQQRQVEVRTGGNWGGGNWNRGNFTGQRQVEVQQQIQQQQVERSRRNYDGQAQQWQRSGVSTDQQTQQWQRRQGTDGQRSWQQSGQTWQQRQGTDGQRSWQRSGQQWTQNSTRYAGNWNRDWRNDRRYDWRRYRDSHRSIFHIGVYFDPFGYGYQPFNIGYRLQPYYYGQQYWIDPAMYNLPYPPPGTMWVRYWNDALLVDTYSGEVVDVIRDFFW